MKGRRQGGEIGEGGGNGALLESAYIRLSPPAQSWLNRTYLQSLAHSSPLLNPSGVAQTGHITPFPGLLEPAHIAASVVSCCNCLWAPDGEVPKGRGLVIVPLAPTPDSRDSGPAEWLSTTGQLVWLWPWSEGPEELGSGCAPEATDYPAPGL